MWRHVMPEADNIARAFDAGAVIRTVNFHLTPARRTLEYDRQFALYAAHFASVTQDDLDCVMRTGRWKKPKPGLILAFYNGYRNNFDVARPLLEKHGLVGWFFVVTGLVNAADQRGFAVNHNITCGDDKSADGRLALSWDEIAALDGPHVVASHTRNHSRASIDPTRLPDEVGGSQKDFVCRLGHPVRAIAWNGGASYGEYQAADQAVDAAGFQFVVSNLKIQRLRDWV
jgi:peptidoglycan/xylan/chitin deacetylase (PgdA/CDA1 family)